MSTHNRLGSPAQKQRSEAKKKPLLSKSYVEVWVTGQREKAELAADRKTVIG